MESGTQKITIETIILTIPVKYFSNYSNDEGYHWNDKHSPTNPAKYTEKQCSKK